MLRAPTLIPSDQFASENHRDSDLYLFAFLLALTTNSQGQISDAREAGQPLYLIHPFEKDLAQPQVWVILGALALKSECAEAITVEIGGQDASASSSPGPSVCHRFNAFPNLLSFLAYPTSTRIARWMRALASAARCETRFI